MADGTLATEAWDRSAIQALFDPATGWLDRRAFSDEALYRLELERIFARCWQFVCHASQIPEVGDYFLNWIGEDQVICVRGEDGEINVLLNTCRHRGNALCRAEQGRAKSFVCSYHGWNYGLDGRLIGVPGLSTYYRGDLDRERLGLAKAAQVDVRHGFVFATLDPDAPPLDEYLGEVGRTGLGMLVAYGDVEVLDGVQKNLVRCNWKIAVDNLFDWYHVMYSHASAGAAGFVDLAGILHPKEQLVMLGDYGHAVSGPGIPSAIQAQIDHLSDEERASSASPMPESAGRIRPRRARELMGPTGVRSIGHPSLFPNLWITLNGLQICLRIPRGPAATELWWFTLVGKDAPPKYRERARRAAIHLFGPAGLLEQDDGENWTQSTRAARGVVSRRLGQALSMGLGHDTAAADGEGQVGIDTQINEHGQRWHYRAWTEWLAAPSWAELKADHTRPPTGRV